MERKVMSHPTPLDQARAAALLARITPRGVRVNDCFYRELRSEGLTRRTFERAAVGLRYTGGPNE